MDGLSRFGSLLVYLIVLLTSAYLLNDKNHKTRLYIALGLLLAIVFAAGRYKVGTDFWTYERHFRACSEESLDAFIDRLRTSDEILFTIVSRYAYKFGGRVLTWGCIASLILVPVYLTLYREYPQMAHGTAIAVFLLTGYVGSFNISRQYIAVSIVFYGMRYIFKRSLPKYLLCIVLASGFHTSALTMLPLWFLWDRKRSRPISILKGVLIVFAIVLMVRYYQGIIRYFSSRIPTFNQYLNYAEERDIGRNRDVYLNLLLLMVATLFYERISEIDNRSGFYLLLFIAAVLIGTTGFTNVFIKREALYCSVPAILFFAGYVPRVREGQEGLHLSVLVVSFFVLRFIIAVYILGRANLIPYAFDLTSSLY